MLILFRMTWDAFAVPGFLGAVLRIMFWPPSRARFDAIVNRRD